MGYTSDGVFTAGKCLNELMQLEAFKGGDFSAAMKRTKIGYLEAINSPLNRSAQAQMPTQQGTKKRVVEIRWRQRAVEGQVETVASGTCTSDDFPDFNSELFDIDKVVETKFKLNTSEFQAVCEGRSKFIGDTINLRFDALGKKINGELLDEQNLNFGINLKSGTSAPTTVTVFPESTGAPNARTLQILQREFEIENEMVGTPIWIGSGNIYDYWKTLAQGCCNDAGIDMLALSNSLGYAPFVDTMIEDRLGDSEFMVLEQNSVQFVPFNDYTGEDATDSGTSVARGTIMDNKTGIRYDMKVLQADCDDDWTVILRLNYGIFFQPGEAFQADDKLFGTNGTLRYKAVTS